LNDPILSYHQGRSRAWVDLLRKLVEFETPTTDKAAVDQMGLFLRQQLEDLGASVTIIPQQSYGDFIRAEFGAGTEGRILVLCHFDTVWPLGQIHTMPIVEREGKLFGPGVYDMKCGIMQTLAALNALRDLGLESKRKIVLLYTTDEEVSSPVSRAVIEDEARHANVTLVLEPSVGPAGSVKTSRKGIGRFQIKVQGRPSHAGGNPKGGISATEEMARQILKLHALTDYDLGTYINVGVIQGGTRANIVAADAVGEIDVRITTTAEGERIKGALLGLTPFHPEAVVTMTGQITRPPLERTEAIAGLFAQAKKMAAEMGFDLAEGHSGGGSDGNFTAALGVPTLDGLGAVGDGAHAYDEHVQIAPIPERAALLTKLLISL
jgi:glutamate carboxypeptidase